MRPLDVERPGSAAAQPGREDGSPSGRTESNSNLLRPFRVVVDGKRPGMPWQSYRTLPEAQESARRLCALGLHARVAGTTSS